MNIEFKTGWHTEAVIAAGGLLQFIWDNLRNIRKEYLSFYKWPNLFHLASFACGIYKPREASLLFMIKSTVMIIENFQSDVGKGRSSGNRFQQHWAESILRNYLFFTIKRIAKMNFKNFYLQRRQCLLHFTKHGAAIRRHFPESSQKQRVGYYHSLLMRVVHRYTER